MCKEDLMSLSPTAPRTFTPAELLRRARLGDRAALGALLTIHRARMRQLALRICRSPADADDAVQEASILVLHKLGQHREDSSFSSWLHRVTQNAALLVLRQRRRQVASSLSDVTGKLMPVDPAVLPDEHCAQRRQLGVVLAAAARLSPVLLKTLELRELNGMDGAEVAAHLGVSLEVVKTRVHRARAALAALSAPPAHPSEKRVTRKSPGPLRRSYALTEQTPIADDMVS
jgi:RNA polymerase sigma-70 factor (ECF subfamily)